jgi:hypothetical protein
MFLVKGILFIARLFVKTSLFITLALISLVLLFFIGVFVGAFGIIIAAVALVFYILFKLVSSK